jgi:ABC-type sugar transport system ATPase subunit
MNDESQIPSKAVRTSGASIEPVLVARGISKSFPGVIALNDVDFEIRPGEVNALVGENGAGKSTLIKIMAGFYVPDRGEIRVNGKHLHADPAAAHRAGIATIHQEPHLVPSMTVAENIMLGHWPSSRFGIIANKEERRHALEVNGWHRNSLHRRWRAGFRPPKGNSWKSHAPCRRSPAS